MLANQRKVSIFRPRLSEVYKVDLNPFYGEFLNNSTSTLPLYTPNQINSANRV